ncbi:MAG: type III ribulose-bisphosphate carboxylase [Nanoarchaeota archaeon]|nr:type III ribulose-bisphosphate carboxylase [Nanoarchaeota archaeon]
MKYEDFLNLKYKPASNDLIVMFRITPSKEFSVKEAAIRVAAESSNGTWSDLKVPKHIIKLQAKVFDINKDIIKVAYPVELFEKNNMSQILSSIAGNIFGMKAVKGLRIEDVTWPKSIIKSFKGPKFGIKGVQKIFGIKDRPITATVPKPKVGYYPSEHAKIGFEAWMGGVDLLKDDENLSNQSFNKFDKRLKLCMNMREKAEKLTGEKKNYLINITAETKEMIKRLKMVKDYGNEYVMIDILTTGWAAVQTIRDEAGDAGLAIHAHRAFHAAFDRNPLHGLSMKVLCEIARMQGVDQLHIGAMGKLAGSASEVNDNHTKTSTMGNKETNTMLAQEWYDTKPVLSMCSGGLHPGIVHPLLEMFGTSIGLQLGGGIHSHPGGTRKGAIALRQAIDAYKKGVNVTEYAKTHKELDEAIKKWGVKVYK